MVKVVTELMQMRHAVAHIICWVMGSGSTGNTQ